MPKIDMRGNISNIYELKKKKVEECALRRNRNYGILESCAYGAVGMVLYIKCFIMEVKHEKNFIF